jgi:hypothetical protein
MTCPVVIARALIETKREYREARGARLSRATVTALSDTVVALFGELIAAIGHAIQAHAVQIEAMMDELTT